MSEYQPLSRRQLRNIQIVRGIPAEELRHRTGMPQASYQALFGAQSGEEGKDAAKLIAKPTFDKLVAILGIDVDITALRATGVIEWRADGSAKTTDEGWAEAVRALVDELFSDDLMLVEVSAEIPRAARGKFLPATAAGEERMVLLHDRQRGYRIAIIGAAEDLIGLMEGAFGITCERRISISSREFHDAREMIRHEVFKSVQFDAFSGAIAPKYNWLDVQAAAREFGFLPDHLIEMMHTKAKERSERAQSGNPAEAGNTPDESEYGVRTLKLVQA